MRRAAPALALMLAATPVAAEEIQHEIAVLQGLDKVTARVMTIEAPVGQSVHFGTLEIVVRTCRTRPPEETPEAAAFLDVWEIRPGQPAADRFRGWMFASSPALSAMEHPVYDIWVLDCRDRRRESPPAAAPGPAAPSPAKPAKR